MEKINLFHQEDDVHYLCRTCGSHKYDWDDESKCYICGGKMANKTVNVEMLECPICGQPFICSDYLKSIFPDDEKTRFVANMITHMRHDHLTSWNKCWGKNGEQYRTNWFGDYEEEKKKVNERQKRQLIRKATSFLVEAEITSENFLKLENTDEKTIDLARKKLGK